MSDLPMQGRVALVAGASNGIGAVTTQAFADADAAVVVAARDAAAVQAVADRIEAGGGRAIAIRSDVTDSESMRCLVDRAITTYGRLDAAFNNETDGPRSAPPAEIDPDEFDLGIAKGPILTHHLQAAGPQAQRLAGLSTLMRRTGTAAEAARVVLWLCAAESSFVTGWPSYRLTAAKPPESSRRRCTGRRSRYRRPSPSTSNSPYSQKRVASRCGG